MLTLFKNDRLAKAYQAILADDQDKLLKQLQKIKKEDINKSTSEGTPGLVETCIQQQKPKLLHLVLKHGAAPSGTGLDNTPYAMIAIQKDESLTLLGELLKAGNEEDKNHLLDQCFEHCPATQRMLHIALLLQYGAEIDQQTLIKALELGELPLIHFLINSGAELPANQPDDNITKESLEYAKKCAADLEIRKMFL